MIRTHCTVLYNIISQHIHLAIFLSYETWYIYCVNFSEYIAGRSLERRERDEEYSLEQLDGLATDRLSVEGQE